MLAAGAGGALHAQCCLGAQHVTETSADGRYSVEARSVPGTGKRHHGPYHFSFRFLERGTEGWLERGKFERSFATRDHFHMRMWISPTGNGFVLRSMLPGFTLLARDGATLATVPTPAGETCQVRGVSDDGTFLELERAPRSSDTAGKRQSRLFVPLGIELGTGPRTPTPPEEWLRRMLHWSPAVGARQAADVATALARRGTRKGDDDLVALGLSAVPALRAVNATKLLGRIHVLAAGHTAPQHNRRLLQALAAASLGDLSATARSRLRSRE